MMNTRNGLSTPLSCYILTFNSARRLGDVLTSIADFVDDIVIVDSGSTDATAQVASNFHTRFLVRPFQDFASQRIYAVTQCRHDWILSVDSDEVVSCQLADRISDLRNGGVLDRTDAPDSFSLRREWFVMGRKVHGFYPSRCPDFPVRLFRKDTVTYLSGRSVHEKMSGHRRTVLIDAPLMHYSCDTIDQMYAKMNLYSTLAARDLRKNGRPSILRVLVMPVLVSLKWYFLEGTWKDGVVGVIHAAYVAETVYQKYIKARYDPDS